jgi:multidrug efflux pump
MTSFNLSDWALKHRSLIWHFMIAFMVAGLFAYLQLGRQEDPDFTIKTMVIQAQWPRLASGAAKSTSTLKSRRKRCEWRT